MKYAGHYIKLVGKGQRPLNSFKFLKKTGEPKRGTCHP